MSLPPITKAILTVAIILALLPVAFYIRKAYEPFASLGEPEPPELTVARDSCNLKIKKDESLRGCALEVAEKSLEARQAAIIAEKWLRIEIEHFPDETTLREAFNLAKNQIYPKLQDPQREKETYELILAQAGTSTLKEDVKKELLRFEFTISTKATSS